MSQQLSETTFQEDEEFNIAVEDQELYEYMEKFSQKASENDVSLEEINSLNCKLKRFMKIMEREKRRYMKKPIQN